VLPLGPDSGVIVHFGSRGSSHRCIIITNVIAIIICGNRQRLLL
jgi:hypothetical protein